jgi:hypothetical protein
MSKESDRVAMNTPFTAVVLGFMTVLRVYAVDVYGAAPTAQTIALGGIYLGSNGATDALASNPALLTSIGQPYLELTGMAVLAGGQFHNATPYVGTLQSNAGAAGSAGFGMRPRLRTYLQADWLNWRGAAMRTPTTRCLPLRSRL